MILPFSNRGSWVIVCCFTVITLGSILFFCRPDKVTFDEEKEKNALGKLPEKLQTPTIRSYPEPDSEATQEETVVSFEETSEERSGTAKLRPATEVLDHIMPPSASADPMFAALIEQITQDTIEDYELKFTKTETKLERTETAFKQVFDNQPENTTHALMTLIREADEEGKAWIREALIERFKSDSDPMIRRACLVCITMFRDVARETLAQALISDSDQGVREVAAYALGQIGSEQEIEPLTQAVRQDRGITGQGRKLAKIAIGALGEIGGEKAAGVLIEIWGDEDLSRGCREQTLVALGMAGDPVCLKTFEAVLQGDEDLIRDNAAYGLGHLAKKNQEDSQGVDKVVNLLRRYVHDGSPGVRGNIIETLGWLGVPDDIDLLNPLLDDDYSIIVNYIEEEQLKERLIYPVREKARTAIDRIRARFTADR